MTKINLTLSYLVNLRTGGNKRRFAEECLNDRPTNLENWISGEKSPTIAKLEPLFNAYPNLNLNWFFRNEGEVFNDNSNEKVFEKKIKEFEKQIAERDERIKFYEDIIKENLRKNRDENSQNQ